MKALEPDQEPDVQIAFVVLSALHSANPLVHLKDRISHHNITECKSGLAGPCSFQLCYSNPSTRFSRSCVTSAKLQPTLYLAIAATSSAMESCPSLLCNFLCGQRPLNAKLASGAKVQAVAAQVIAGMPIQLLLNYLGQGYKLVLVGQSFGGLIAHTLAAKLLLQVQQEITLAQQMDINLSALSQTKDKVISFGFGVPLFAGSELQQSLAKAQLDHNLHSFWHRGDGSVPFLTYASELAALEQQQQDAPAAATAAEEEPEPCSEDLLGSTPPPPPPKLTLSPDPVAYALDKCATLLGLALEPLAKARKMPIVVCSTTEGALLGAATANHRVQQLQKGQGSRSFGSQEEVLEPLNLSNRTSQPGSQGTSSPPSSGLQASFSTHHHEQHHNQPHRHLEKRASNLGKEPEAPIVSSFHTNSGERGSPSKAAPLASASSLSRGLVTGSNQARQRRKTLSVSSPRQKAPVANHAGQPSAAGAHQGSETERTTRKQVSSNHVASSDLDKQRQKPPLIPVHKFSKPSLEEAKHLGSSNNASAGGGAKATAVPKKPPAASSKAEEACTSPEKAATAQLHSALSALVKLVPGKLSHHAPIGQFWIIHRPPLPSTPAGSSQRRDVAEPKTGGAAINIKGSISARKSGARHALVEPLVQLQQVPESEVMPVALEWLKPSNTELINLWETSLEELEKDLMEVFPWYTFVETQPGSDQQVPRILRLGKLQEQA